MDVLENRRGNGIRLKNAVNWLFAQRDFETMVIVPVVGEAYD